MATLKCTAQIKYVVRITFSDKKEYYLAPSVYKAKRLEENPFLNYKIKYFPDETFYEWHVYIDYRCRCLLVQQKEEGISKAFYHVYENDIISVTNEKNNRKITICSKNGTIETI